MRKTIILYKNKKPVDPVAVYNSIRYYCNAHSMECGFFNHKIPGRISLDGLLYDVNVRKTEEDLPDWEVWCEAVQ